ncbi:MAG: hypothetical protein JJU11_02310 [Candidatus Sumerlaeia bacterium]|nr:hypothetical protein [Candidatus Sumerlaeia bacterium]
MPELLAMASLALLPLAPQTLMAQEMVEAPEEIVVEVIALEETAEYRQHARAEIIDSEEFIPTAFWAHGSYQDISLSNGLAGMILGAVPEERKDYNASRQGNVIDLFASPASEEGFQLFQPMTTTSARSVLVTEVDLNNDGEEGHAVVTTYGEDTQRSGLTVDTTYEMRPGYHGALVTTTLTNTTDDEMNIPILGDYILWGVMRPFAPGQGWNLPGREANQVEFAMGRFSDAYVMIAPRTGLLDIKTPGSHSIITYKSDVTLQPGESTSYERWLLVADRDPGRLYSFFHEQRGSAHHGYIAGQVNERVRLPDGNFQVTRPVANAEIRIIAAMRRDLPDGYFGRPYIYTISDENGNYQISIPPGDYTLSAYTPGRPFELSTDTVRVNANRITGVDHVVPISSTVTYEIVDAETGEHLPGKLSFVPLRGTNPPYFGGSGGLESGASVYSQNGRGSIDVPTGNFRVIASHGVEYHTTEKRVTTEYFRDQTVRFEMRRAYDTSGWISADLGVLTGAAAHSRMTDEDRVVTALAEGVQWIVTADPGKATDIQPTIRRMGVGNKLRATPGLRVIGNADNRIGDYTLFPINDCDPAQIIEEAIAAGEPIAAIETLRALCPNALLLLNRPVFPGQGVMTHLGYDFAGHTWPNETIYLDVDGFQVWEGKRQLVATRSTDVLLELAAQGTRATPFGNSLSSGTYNDEIGYPRVFIPSSESDPSKFDLDELVTNIREGRIMVTNGPFIDLKVDGRPMGSQVTLNGTHVEVDLSVFTPNWANVSSITINVNGSFARKFLQPAGSYDRESGQVFPSPDKPEEGKFNLRISRDSILQVIVEGDIALNQDPVNPNSVPARDPNVPQGQYSLAISAPIYIDANGDGAVNIESRVQRIIDEEVPAF